MIVGYINGQSLELHHSSVVEKSVDYLTADFQFMTNEWKGFRKWVHFSKGDIHYQIELKNDRVLKTDHLNLSSGEWDVYIHGSLEREIITTNKAKLVVEATGELEGEHPEETPIPPYDDILNKMGDIENLKTTDKTNLVNAINEVLRKANQGGGTGEGGNGVGIEKIEQTTTSTESSGKNIITVYLTNGDTYDFEIKNGRGIAKLSATQSFPIDRELEEINVNALYSDGYNDQFTFWVPCGKDGKNGKDGKSGVYVGSGDMPDGYNVQVDPDGEAVVIPTKVSELENDVGYITLADIPEIPESSGDLGQFVEKLGDGVNKYEPQTEGWVDDAILNNNGVPNYNASTYKAYAVTPEIPIKGSTIYTVKPKPYTTSLNDKYKARTYDSSGTALDYMTYTENEDGSATFTTPENSATLRITIHMPTFGGKTTENANDIDTVIENFNSTFMLVEGTEAPEVYEPFGSSGYKLKDIALPDKSVNIENISDKALPIFASLADKKIVNFGDSIFGNARPPRDVSTFLAEKTGAEVLNCAFGGCRMGLHTGHWDAFSMYRLADAIANNDYSLQEDALNYDDRVSYAEEPLALIKSTEFSTVDIATISYCTNDFTGGNKIDNEENPYDTTTLGGALRYSIEKLLTAYPNLRIFVLSATYRFWKDDNNEFTEDSSTYLNKHSKTLPEYNAKLAEVASEYNLPFIDNYNIGIGKFNRYQYFPVTDGTHHNETGRKLIASHLAKELY